MNMTIIMLDGKSLHINQVKETQVAQFRQAVREGRGAFEFTLDGRTYIINVASVVYAELSA